MDTFLPVPEVEDRRGRHAGHTSLGEPSRVFRCDEGGHGETGIVMLNATHTAQRLGADGLAVNVEVVSPWFPSSAKALGLVLRADAEKPASGLKRRRWSVAARRAPWSPRNQELWLPIGRIRRRTPRLNVVLLRSGKR